MAAYFILIDVMVASPPDGPVFMLTIKHFLDAATVSADATLWVRLHAADERAFSIIAFVCDVFWTGSANQFTSFRMEMSSKMEDVLPDGFNLCDALCLSTSVTRSGSDFSSLWIGKRHQTHI
jgi:hypothetical protein